jgi:hypothetical protein
MPSFDVVSKLDWAEVMNALNQAQREVGTRFDFKDTATELDRVENALIITSNAEDRARAAQDVLEQKIVRRKVSLKHFEPQPPETGSRGSAKIVVKVKEGIDSDNARKIVKLIKDAKLKVQAAIIEQTVRVTGKKKDDLQQAIQLLRGAENLNLDLQFINFRD